MNCKDCLHYEVRESYSKRESLATLYCAEECPGFTDKFEWVYLPCNVGDTNTCRHGETEIRHAKFELVANGKGVCSNCHRLDSIDNLAKYCRYCGAKIDGEER